MGNLWVTTARRAPCELSGDVRTDDNDSGSKFERCGVVMCFL